MKSLLTAEGRSRLLQGIEQKTGAYDYRIETEKFFSPELDIFLCDDYVIMRCIEKKVDVAKALLNPMLAEIKSEPIELKPLLSEAGRYRLLAERKKQTGKDDYSVGSTGFFFAGMGMGLYDEHVIEECVNKGVDVARALIIQSPDEPKINNVNWFFQK